MPGKCFPLSFAQQIFALKGSVCSASGCGTAAASTGWGHEVLRWAQVQTQHTQAHAGAPQKSWGGAGHGDKCGHGPLRGTEVTKPQRGCGDRWVERVRSLGLSLEPPPPGEKPALAWTVLCPQPQAPGLSPQSAPPTPSGPMLCPSLSVCPRATVHCVPGPADLTPSPLLQVAHLAGATDLGREMPSS